MTQPAEEWAPKTREDFVSVFADAMDAHHARRTEAEEKAKADAAAAEADALKNAPPKRRTAAERLMGIKD